MQNLNFPSYTFKYKNKENKQFIFDIIRKAYFLLTPEEWVRQHMIRFLIENGYSESMIAVEKQLNINGLKRRFDIVVFNKQMRPEILVECKAANIKISQKTFDQANRYNWLLKAPFLILTNGIKHIYCRIDFEKNSFIFLKELPHKNKS